jgi:hypothetical protein
MVRALPWLGSKMASLVGSEATVQIRLGGEREAISVCILGSQVVTGDLCVNFAVQPRDARINVHRFYASVLSFVGPAAAAVAARCAPTSRPRDEPPGAGLSSRPRLVCPARLSGPAQVDARGSCRELRARTLSRHAPPSRETTCRKTG